MAGINDRVQGFLDSWPIVKEQLDRLLEEEKKDFSGDQKSGQRLPHVTGDPTLSEADTLQKVKELKNLALTAADWAKRKGMGEEAIQYCRSYAMEAERRMGEMLAQTERAKGGNPNLPTSNIVLPVAPTLSDLGLTKRESAEAQMLASIWKKKEFSNKKMK